MSNKADGTAFEKEVAKIFAENGWWAHLLKDTQTGQPFDLLVANNNMAYPIDCKECKGDRFEFRRIEENQRSAFELWQECGNAPGNLAIRIHDRIYILSYCQVMVLEEHGVKSLTEADLKGTAFTLKEFFDNESNNQQ